MTPGQRKTAKGEGRTKKKKGQKRNPNAQQRNSNSVHCVVQDQDPSMYEQFDMLSFDVIKINSVEHDTRREAFPKLNIKLQNRPGTHELKAKVDTGAEGNTLPLRIFQKMFPESVNDCGLPREGTTEADTKS